VIAGTAALAVATLALPGRSVTVKSLATQAPHAKGPVRGVRILGHDGAVEWTPDAGGLNISMPDRPAGEHAVVFAISGVL